MAGLMDTIEEENSNFVYQTRLLMLFFERAYFQDLEFSLGRGNIFLAGRFEDLVFNYAEGGKLIHRFLQIKYLENTSKNINSKVLRGEETEIGYEHFKNKFNLESCFVSYMKIKDSLKESENAVLKDVMIFTNLGLDVEELNSKGVYLNKIRDSFLDFSVIGKSPAFYKLIVDKSSDVYNYLKTFSDEYSLAADLIKFAFKGKKSKRKQFKNFKMTTLVIYYSALFPNVLVPYKDKLKFAKDFIKGDVTLPYDVSHFRDAFEKVGTKTLELTKEQFWNRVKNSKLEPLEDHAHYEISGLPSGKVPNEHEIDNFFNDLIFAVNQPNSEELMNIIKYEDMRKYLNLVNNNFIVISLETYILRWVYETEGGEGWISIALCKKFFEEAVGLVSSVEVVGVTLSYKEGLKNYGIEFDEKKKEIEGFSQFLDYQNGRQVLIINAEETLLTSIKVYCCLKERIDYKSNDSNIFIEVHQMKKNELKKKIFNVFKTTCNMLILECRNRDSVSILLDVFDDITEILQNKKKKLIMIVRPDVYIEPILASNVQRIKNDIILFSYFTPDTQMKLLDKKISFQDHQVPLRNLFVNDDLEGMDAIISNKIIVKIIKNKEIRLGLPVPMSKGYNEQCYINRVLYAKGSVRSEINGDTKFPDHLAFDKDEFNNLCEKHPKGNVHWLRRNTSTVGYDWVNSYGRTSNLVKYRGELKFNRRRIIVPIREESIFSVNKDRIVVISDTAGMGKSTILTNLSNSMKKNNPSMWVLRINLNDCTQYLEQEERKIRFLDTDYDSLNNISAAKDSLCEILKSNNEIRSIFEEHVFEYYLSHEGKTALFFDSFDEINPTHQNTIIKFTQALIKNTNVARVCIASRPYARDLLEDRLNVFSYSLGAFREKEQVTFLTRFWQSRNYKKNDEKVRCFAETLIKSLGKSISSTEKELIGIPLQARMIAEIFEGKRVDSELLLELEDDFEVVSVGLEEFYHSNNREPMISEKFNLFNLYDQFIYKQYWNIYEGEKKKTDLLQYDAQQDLKELFENFKKDHQQLALYSLLTNKMYEEVTEEEERKRLNILVERVKNGQERRGLIGEINGDKPQFIYRSFAEYFLAEYIAHYLQGKGRNSDLEYFLIEKVLMLVDFNVVRIFLNHQFLRKKNRIQKIYSCGKKLRELWLRGKLANDSGENIIHSIIDENHMGIVYFIESCLKKNRRILKSMINSKDSSGKSVFYHALLLGNVDACKWMMKKNVKIDTAREDNLLGLAAEHDCPEIAEYLLSKGVDINESCHNHRKSLFYAVEKESFRMTNLLITKGAEINSQGEGESPLHLAVKTQNLEIVELLLQKGADVNIRNDVGATPLHVAAKQGNLELVRCLVKAGANTNAKYNSGTTILESAVKSRKLNVVKCVVENGAQVRGIDLIDIFKDGLETGYREIVQYLQEQGATKHHRFSEITGKGIFFTAIQNGNVDLATILLEEGRSVDDRYVNGETPLHAAAESSTSEFAKKLIEKGADINAEDYSGRTVFQTAIKSGNAELIDDLIDLKVKIEEVAPELLIKVVTSANLKLLNYLIEHGVNIDDVTDAKEETLLHIAVRKGHLEIIKCLLQNTAKVNAKSKFGETALHLAVESGIIEIVDLLLEKKCQEHARNKYFDSIVHYAVRSGNLEMVRYVVKIHNALDVKNRLGETGLHTATKLGHLEIGRFLIESGADPNDKNIHNKTPLVLAIENRNPKFVELLVEKGADVNMETDQKETVVHLAAKANNIEIVKYLVEKGAKVDAINLWGITALELVVMLGNLEIVKFLIEKDAPLISKNKHGISPLHLAVKSRNLEIVKLLLSKDANVNDKDRKGFTALHLAVKYENLEMVQYLLSNGADIKATNKNLETVLHLAVDHENIEMIEYLLEKGADVNSKNAYDETILQIARISGNRELLDILKRSYLGINFYTMQKALRNLIRWPIRNYQDSL